MNEYRDYDILYPNLITEILEYFWCDVNLDNKKVVDFCRFCTHNPNPATVVIQPEIIVKICDRLVQLNTMSCLRRGGVMGFENCYCFVWKKPREKWEETKHIYNFYFSSLVYGFEYIYRHYRDKVLPIVAEKSGDKSMGTVFRCLNGLVTARHCIEGHDSYMIKGYTAQQLQTAPIFVSKNPAIDIAYIYTGEPSEVYCDAPKVLDEVLVMGYPRVALFLDFLTAEKATISTMVKARMTPSRGSIAATAKTIWTGEQDLMLITAKIKGGNSGGPIINNRGCVVGVAFADPSAEGLYDEIGYGVGMPIQVLNDIIAEGRTMSVNFIDWNEE